MLIVLPREQFTLLIGSGGFHGVIKKVDPCRPSSVELANHLSDLSITHKLSAAALKVRRAAICTTIRQMGLPLVPLTSIVSDVIKGSALRQAKQKVPVPAWDLFLVLAFLRSSSSFEPLEIASLTKVSQMTAFLTMLASGRRASEIHGLSGLPGHVAEERDGSVTLNFVPEFLAKTKFLEIYLQ